MKGAIMSNNEELKKSGNDLKDNPGTQPSSADQHKLDQDDLDKVAGGRLKFNRHNRRNNNDDDED